MCQAAPVRQLDRVPPLVLRDVSRNSLGLRLHAARLGLVMDDAERKARLAYAIREASERRGMTPPQLAAKLGVQRNTVNAWESPHKTAAPSLLMLGRLCDALGVDARLFADLPPIPVSPVDDYLTADLTPEEAAALRAVDAAEQEQPKPTGDGARAREVPRAEAHE